MPDHVTHVVCSKTNLVGVLLRTAVYETGDLEETHKIQDTYTVTTLTGEDVYVPPKLQYDQTIGINHLMSQLTMEEVMRILLMEMADHNPLSPEDPEMEDLIAKVNLCMELGTVSDETVA